MLTGVVSIQKHYLTSIGIPIIKIRRYFIIGNTLERRSSYPDRQHWSLGDMLFSFYFMAIKTLMVHILLTTISNALWWTNIVAFWWKIQRCLFFQRGLLTITKYPITAYSAIGSVIPYQLAISSHSHVDLLYDRLTILVRGPHSRSVLGQKFHHHYDDVIMTMLASQITSLPVVCSIVYSDVNQRKHQSSASLAFVREIHRGPVNFPHKWPITRKMFPFDDVIMTSVGHTMNNVAVFTTH